MDLRMYKFKLNYLHVGTSKNVLLCYSNLLLLLFVYITRHNDVTMN